MEGKTNRDLVNVGEGRAKDDHRWVKSDYADLLWHQRQGRVEFLAWDEESVKVCAEGTYGMGRHKFVREAARTYLNPPNSNVTAFIKVDSTRPPDTTSTDPPYSKAETGHHTYRPRGFPTR